MAEAISERIFSILHHPKFIFKWTAWGKQEYESRKTFDQAAPLVMENQLSQSKVFSNISEPMPFITKLMCLKHTNPTIFSEQAIKDEIDTLVVGVSVSYPYFT